LESLIAKLPDLQSDGAENKKLQTKIHATIKEVSEDIMHYRLNKAIARVRELYNAVSDEMALAKFDLDGVKEAAKAMVQLLNPFIPHITEELWQKMGNDTPLYNAHWPKFDESKLEADSYTMAIQVKGKLRATHDFAISASDDEIKKIAIELPAVAKHIDGVEIRKIIVVPKKIVNIVV
jgi:leucyl-tRNA synthetase